MKKYLILFCLLYLVVSSPIMPKAGTNDVLLKENDSTDSMSLKDNAAQIVSLETNKVNEKKEALGKKKSTNPPSVKENDQIEDDDDQLKQDKQIMEAKKILQRELVGELLKVHYQLQKLLNIPAHILTPKKLQDILAGDIDISIPGMKKVQSRSLISLIFQYIRKFNTKVLDNIFSSIYNINDKLLENILGFYIRHIAGIIKSINKWDKNDSYLTKHSILYDYLRVLLNHFQGLLNGKTGKIVKKALKRVNDKYPKEYNIFIKAVGQVQDNQHIFSDKVFKKLFYYSDDDKVDYKVESKSKSNLKQDHDADEELDLEDT